ncbi:hypothetical protein JTB14_003844 [Gonioctena quinquepunctata]|nr:hypothetical protein JTB14_003844 [Gonioctena quinquepunctata]
MSLTGICRTHFIDCVINEEPLRGYVDSGCAAVTLRDFDFKRLKLRGEPTLANLRGYGGGSVCVDTKVSIHLEVDLASATVEALVVPDIVQDVSVIVGQPFVNNENVMVVVHGNQIRLLIQSYPKYFKGNY